MKLEDVFDKVEVSSLTRLQVDTTKPALPAHYGDTETLTYIGMMVWELRKMVTKEQFHAAHFAAISATAIPEEKIEELISIHFPRRGSLNGWYCLKCGETEQPRITGLGADQIFCGNCGEVLDRESRGK